MLKHCKGKEKKIIDNGSHMINYVTIYFRNSKDFRLSQILNVYPDNIYLRIFVE